MTDLSPRCPHCNRSLPPESRFCPRCGLPTAAGETRTQAMAKERPFWLDVVDKSWDFFASTRLAVILIVLLAVASIGGTLIEQESLYQDWRPPYLYYPVRYGPTLGPVFMKLGLTHAYTSLWFQALVWLLVINLIIGSLHRLVPLHRVLTRPQTKKEAHFVRRQPVLFALPATPTALDDLAKTFKKRGYRIWRFQGGLHADRGRLGRYGPYILHIGLILVALFATLKVVPGFDETKDLWLADGETVQVPGLDWSIKDDRFIMTLYPNGMPSRYATDLHVLDSSGQVVKSGSTEVNHPVDHGQYEIYQASFRREYGTATFAVKVGEGDQAQSVGSFTMDLRRPEAEYAITPNLKVRLQDYFNDLTADSEGHPGNNSPNATHPALRAEFVDGTGAVLGQVAAVFPELSPAPRPGEQLKPPEIAFSGPISLAYTDQTIRWYSGLRLHKDLTVPFFFSGAAVVLLGLLDTFFIFHQQIWVLQEGDEVLVGARTNKNTYTLRQNLKRLLQVEPMEPGGKSRVLSGPLGTPDVVPESEPAPEPERES